MHAAVIVCFILAVLCFLLVLFGVAALGILSLTALGFVFLSVGILLEALSGHVRHV